MNQCECPPEEKIVEISRAQALAFVEESFETSSAGREEDAVRNLKRNYEYCRARAQENADTLTNSRAKTFFRQNGRLYPKRIITDSPCPDGKTRREAGGNCE